MLLDAILVVVRLFQFVFFLLKLATWPVRALVRLWERKRKATLERQQYVATEARYEEERAVRGEFEREQAEHRAAGEHVPRLDRHQIYSICRIVAQVYGYANEIHHDGMPLGLLATAFREIHARFDPLTAAMFGVNPQSVVRPGSDDYYNCLAASAILFIAGNQGELTIIADADDTSLISGVAGCAWLGVFARAVGSTPKVGFVRKFGRDYYDYYYVAANFTPDQASAEGYYRYWREGQERLERQKSSSDPFESWYGASMESPALSGIFRPQLTWLTELLFSHRQDT